MRRCTGLLGVFVVAELVNSSSAVAQTLQEAMATAYRTNPTLQAAQARLRQVDEQVATAKSNWRPSITGNAAVARERGVFDAPGITSSALYLTPSEVSVQLQQPLYRGGRTVAAVSQAENNVLAERAALTAIEQQVLLDAGTTFVNVLATQAVVRLTVQNEQRLARFLEATKDRFAVGEVTRTDLAQAEARLAQGTADRIRAEADLEAARAQYVRVIGEFPKNLKLPEPIADLPSDLATAIERASFSAIAGDTSQVRSVDEADFRTRAATDQVALRKGELLPELNFVASAGRLGEQAIVDDLRNEIRAGVRLSVPIFQQGGATYSRLRAAKQAVTEASQTFDDERRRATQSATQSWNDLEAARSAVKAFRKSVEANEIAVDGAVREQAVGTRTVLDVLDTQRDLLDSQVRLVGAQRDEIVAALALRVTAGTLTAEFMNLAVERYNPNRYYNAVRNRWFGGSINVDSSSTEPLPTPER